MARKTTRESDVHQPLSAKLNDPVTMTPEERLSYIARLEAALGRASSAAQQVKPADADWTGNEKRYALFQPGPTGDPIRINGKAYVGRRLVTKEEFDSVNEIYNRALRSELSRMQQRGNLTPPHLLARDDISSRTTPVTIANL